MQRHTERHSTSRQLGALLALAGLALSACSPVSSSAETGASHGEPATVKTIAGTGLAKITLTERAIERLDVQTTTVRTVGSGTAIPYSAVLYDADGGTWTFISAAPRTFTRHPIEVVDISGNVATLSAGPAAGTAVVSVGAAELYGAELGVDH